MNTSILCDIAAGTLPVVSFAPEVIADASGKWCGNALRFATQEEAQANVRALASRWFSVTDTRVVPSTDPVSHQWVDGALVPVPAPLVPHSLLEVWRPDECAECLPGVSKALYRRIWNDLVPLYDGDERSEVPDDFSERCVAKFWDKLTREEQTELNQLAAAFEAAEVMPSTAHPHGACAHCFDALPGPYGTVGVSLSRADNKTLLCSDCGTTEALTNFVNRYS